MIRDEQGGFAPARADADIPVLTLHQPWASLIALGRKSFETRSWSTNYRGPLAIHAAASVPREVLGLDIGGFTVEKDNPRGTKPAYLLRGPIAWPYRLPLGAIVAVCELAEILPIEGANMQGFDEFVCPDIGGGLTLYRFERGGDHPPTVELDVTDELPFGDFTDGRYAWRLERVRHLDPLAFRGGQALSRKIAADALGVAVPDGAGDTGVDLVAGRPAAVAVGDDAPARRAADGVGPASHRRDIGADRPDREDGPARTVTRVATEGLL